jgi:hypothetical protein
VNAPIGDVMRTTGSRPRLDPDTVLGTVLRHARLMAGLTCEAAAECSGLSATRIAGIEEGDGLLLFADALPLARAYRQSLPELARRFQRDLEAAEGVRA